MKTLNLESLKWDITQSFSTQGQTFYVSTEQGDFFIIQMVYSTMSWSPTVQVTFRYYSGDRTQSKSMTQSIQGSTFKLEDENFSSSCDLCSFQMKSKHPITFHITLKAQDVVLDLVFTCMDSGFEFSENGKQFFMDDQMDAGFVSSCFIPCAKVAGSFVLNGKFETILGQGTLVHALQHKPQSAARWNFLSFHSLEKDALMLYQFEAMDNASNQLKSTSRGALVLDGKMISILFDNATTLQLSKTRDEFSGYFIPENVIHVLKGKTLDDQPVDIEVELELNNLLEKIDVLGELPFLIKKVLQTFITAPFIYQWLEETVIRIKIGDEYKEIHGRAFHENTFLMDITK